MVNRHQMLTEWVKELNPKAYLKMADARCGKRYAVCTPGKPGECYVEWTAYYPLKELELILMAHFNHERFMKIKDA